MSESLCTDLNGDFISVDGVARDVTQTFTMTKKLEKSESRYRTLFEGNKIVELKNEEGELLVKFSKLELVEADYQYPTSDVIDIYDEQADIQHTISILDGQMLSMKEMQIVYLYKNVEILLKEMISTAFPDANKKDLFA